MAESTQRQHITQQLKQVQRLSQQQVRFVRMLEMSGAEAAQDIRREIDENPALELAEPPLSVSQKESDSTPLSLASPFSAVTSRGEFFQPPAVEESLYEALGRQLDTLGLDSDVDMAARYLVGNLDPNGYLRRSVSAISTDILMEENIELPEEVMAEALQIIKTLDPPGVGAENLKQNMLIQLERIKPSQTRTDAINIVRNRFDDLAKRRFNRLSGITGGDSVRLANALSLLRGLNPKPGAKYADHETSVYISPDFLINVEGDNIEVSLASNVPELALSTSFTHAMSDMERRRATGRDKYIMQRYADAREYMRILSRRQNTLMDVMTAIVSLQKQYFLSLGDESLLTPMGLRDVAEASGLDVSNISRATKNKYVAMPWAMVPLRFFFSEGFATKPSVDSTGREDAIVSGRGVEQAIRATVGNEDKKHPLSDEAICNILHEQGFDVSRRTVSKYRDRLNIPIARLRTEH